MGPETLNWAEGVGEQAATDSTGGRIAIAAIGAVIGVIPGGYLLYLMIRSKMRGAVTEDLTVDQGYGWSPLAQELAFTFGGAVLTLVGLFLVGLAIWPPKHTTPVAQHERGFLSLSNPWAWVIIGLTVMLCMAWAFMSRDDGRRHDAEPPPTTSPEP